MKILRLGSEGPFVQMIQTALIRSGYLSGSPNGIFDNNTENAVRRFQREFGLSPDGIVGPLTYAQLQKYLLGYAVITIKRGDTYYRLAKTYGTTPEAILSANPGINPLNLQPGEQIILPFGYNVVPTDISFTYELLAICLDGLQVRYPFIRRNTIGTTSYGRNLYSFAIGNGTKNVAYNASHHANEWITTPILLHFAEEYLKAYITGGNIGNTSAAELFRETTIHFVPMVNPDGVNLVTGAYDADAPEYQQALGISAGYPDIPFPSGWKANIDGTDINLNYPAGWENAREIKFAQGFTTPAPRDYVGAAPLSAPESFAMTRFTEQGNFLLTLSYHTQGNVIYWRFLDYNPENAFSIGETLSAVSGYALENTPYQSGFAGYKDWYIQEFNRPGYTIEAGIGTNPLPIRDFPEIYRANENLLVQAALLA